MHADNTEVGIYTGKVKEVITANDNKCHFCHRIFDLQSSLFSKEEKTELHEDDAEIETDTEKAKEDDTASDNNVRSFS